MLLLEGEAIQEVVEELEKELETNQRERKYKLLDIEKLKVKLQTIKHIASKIPKDEDKQKYLDYFKVDDLEKKHNRLKEEYSKDVSDSSISYLKATIGELKKRL